MSAFEMKLDASGEAFDGDRYIEFLEAAFEDVLDRMRSGDYLNGKHSNITAARGDIVGTFKLTW